MQVIGPANGQLPSSSNVPSIQSGTVVLSGVAGLGLEGMGIRENNVDSNWGRPPSDRRGAGLTIGGRAVGPNPGVGPTSVSPSKGSPSPSRRKPGAVVRGLRGYQPQL